MKTHYALKGTLYYPGAACNRPGLGRITENIDDVECKTCRSIAEKTPKKVADIMRRAGMNSDGMQTKIMAGQRNEGE